MRAPTFPVAPKTTIFTRRQLQRRRSLESSGKQLSYHFEYTTRCKSCLDAGSSATASVTVSGSSREIEDARRVPRMGEETFEVGARDDERRGVDQRVTA